MDIEGIAKIIRDSLGLDSDVPIVLSRPIVEIEGGAGRVDVADILFKVGAYDTSHLSCGNINNDGREFLRKVGHEYEDYSDRFDILSLAPSENILNMLTPNDICIMAEYREALVV